MDSGEEGMAYHLGSISFLSEESISFLRASRSHQRILIRQVMSSGLGRARMDTIRCHLSGQVTGDGISH